MSWLIAFEIIATIIIILALVFICWLLASCYYHTLQKHSGNIDDEEIISLIPHVRIDENDQLLNV
jgi:hypothetical protein